MAFFTFLFTYSPEKVRGNTPSGLRKGLTLSHVCFLSFTFRKYEYHPAGSNPQGRASP